MSKPILSLKNICQTYAFGTEKLDILKEANLDIYAGELVALIAPSGAGKSTLLHIAGLLEKPTDGQVILDGQELAKAGDKKRTLARRHDIGFIYQFHHLLPEFSAIENVILPQRIAGLSLAKAKAHGEELLGRVGLLPRKDHRPAQLSGGEKQRIAIARALANRPKLLLADEPTGNLDPKTADGVFDLMIELVRHANMAGLIATHNLELAKRMDRVVYLENGKVISLKL